MDAFRLQLKLFAAAGAPPAEAFIPVFHNWVKHHTLPELLIDVANYAHVPQGPGVALIGHATDYYIDDNAGRPGLLVSRKRQPAAPGDRLADLFRRTFHAAALLEAEPAFAGKLKLATNELSFRINDRLLGPNTPATFAAVKPELAAFAERLYGGGVELTSTGEARELFTVTIKAKESPSLAALLERAGGPPTT